ncbi:UPF0716 protein FxsA [Pseudomonas duriflava]|uniref:UPF0716 protein FxsA n=1 Tax=Pseudomonas duriflava TaxID=459528 RepID=A0A562QQY5_9PSED|nr:FxsA family protein [Pseudomonas duriflava]TWI58496.1 UPF0716 protein FxsA [Pseudomonas duriflava]
MRVFFFLFLLFPLLELAVLIKLGSAVGVGWTLILLILSTFVGIGMVRVAGFATIWRARMRLAMGEMPEKEITQGLTLGISGILFILPGFISDVFALLILLPVTRKLLVGAVVRRLNIRTAGQFRSEPHNSSRPEGPKVIEGEYERRDD